LLRDCSDALAAAVCVYNVRVPQKLRRAWQVRCDEVRAYELLYAADRQFRRLPACKQFRSLCAQSFTKLGSKRDVAFPDGYACLREVFGAHSDEFFGCAASGVKRFENEFVAGWRYKGL
jgi:hypothetical protein